MRMQRVLASLASSNRFEHSWSVSFSAEVGTAASESLLAEQTYRSLLNKGFPAESYFLSFDLRIREIEAVEFLKAFCGPKDEILVPLGGCPLPGEDEHYFNLELETTHRGHRLLVEASIPIDVKEMSTNLGVELIERGHG